MGIQINRITNANVYMDGISFLGQAEEIKLPDINAEMTEHKALGLVGKFELPTGFAKMEGEIKFNSLYREAFLKVMNPFVAVQLMARSSVDTYASTGRTGQVSLVTHLTVLFKKAPLGSFKPHDNAEFSGSFAVHAVKQVLDNVDVIELDVMANIFKVGGVDQLAQYRANIGG